VQGNERLIIADAYEIANTIEHDPELFDEHNRVRADILFTKLAILTKDRGLQAAYILDSHGHVLGSTKQRFLPEIAPPKPRDIDQAMHGMIVIDASSKVGVVRALIRMQALNRRLPARWCAPSIRRSWATTSAPSTRFRNTGG